MDRNCTDVITALSRRWQETQMFDTVMVSVVKSCLGPCELGPTMVVYPDNAWYNHLDAEKAVKIFDSHVSEGKPAEEFLALEGSF
jgi:(2Fe-2S) ferredoxin